MKKKQTNNPDVDPVRGDEILKRMLKTKPETHKQMIKGGKTKKPKGAGHAG